MTLEASARDGRGRAAQVRFSARYSWAPLAWLLFALAWLLDVHADRLTSKAARARRRMHMVQAAMQDNHRAGRAQRFRAARRRPF